MKPWLLSTAFGGVVITAFLLAWWLGLFSRNPSAAKAIPSDAITVYQGTQPLKAYKRLKASSTARVLQDADGVKNFNKKVQILDSFTRQAPDLFTSTKRNPFYISLHKPSFDKLGLLLSWRTPTSDLLYLLHQHLTATFPDLKVKKRQFNAYPIRDYSLNGEALFTLGLGKGILLASYHSILVEDGLRKLQNRTKKAFLGMNNGHSGNEGLYVNYQRFPQLLGTFTKPRLQGVMNQTTRLPGYARYRMQVQDNALQLSGPFHITDSLVMAAFHQKAASPLHFDKVTPMHVAFLHAFSLPEPQPGKSLTFHRQHKLQTGTENVDSLEAWYGFDLNQDFRPLLGHQVCLGITEPINEEFRDQVFAVMHYRDTSSGFKSLRAFAKQKQAIPTATTTYTNLEYRDYRMRQLSVGPAFKLVLGPLFKALENPYYTTIEDCALLASRPTTLKRLIDDYEGGQTLENAPHYKELQTKLLSSSQQFTYVNPGRARQLPLSFLAPSVKKAYQQGFPYYSGFSGLAFQVKSDSAGFFSQVTLMERTTTRSTTQKLWEQSLDAPLSASPQMVINPENQKPQFLITDKEEQLYLINNDGAIEWKKPLITGKMGPADTIDLYQNGNQQFLFATRGKLHLLNHKGKEVGGFPISLSAPAVTELRTFSNAGNGNYQYFIGCQNNNVYGYQDGGTPLRGWSPLALKAPLAFPVKYFQYNGKIRLFGVTKTGKLYIWNRSGEVQQQWNFKTQFQHPFAMHFGATDSTTYMVSTDTNARAHFVYLNEDTVSRHFQGFTKEHHFLLADLNRDGAKSLIFAENRKIEGYLPNGTREFTLTLRDTLSFKPQIYNLHNRSYIGYVSASKDRIFLIDQSGKPLQGFPLKGNTPFLIADVNRDNAQELLVGGKHKNLILYQIE